MFKEISFVVNVSMLDDPMDIRADENGVWMRKHSPVAFVSKHIKGNSTLTLDARLVMIPITIRIPEHTTGIAHLLTSLLCKVRTCINLKLAPV